MNAQGNLNFTSTDLTELTGLDITPMQINNSGEILLATRNNQQGIHGYLLVPKSDRLGVDFDRDGVIDTSRDPANPDRELARRGLPWYFWLNDDDDSGETDGSDIPGKGPNSGDGVVNGVRDLVDFFPVHLDITGLLGSYPADDPTITYKLAQANSAANYLITDLTPATASDYQRDADVAKTVSTKPGTNDGTPAIVTQITADGVPLDRTFLGKILTEGRGIILVEASKATTEPLRLEVWRGNAKVGGVELPLNFAGVESMFRHRNLVGAVKMVPETSNRDGAPNWPDELNNGKAFVFVHGYNVNQQQARGSQAEFFKRLWWSGSRAQFWGVTWYGSFSQIHLPDEYATPDFHSNVVNAFGTAPKLADFIAELHGKGLTDINVAAHSLGNTVVSSAISDHGADVSRYSLINAAPPAEAYSVSERQPADATANMPHTGWTRERGAAYPARLWASDWYNRFPATGDARHGLTWTNRFAPAPNSHTVYYDFYSSGEQVLSVDTGDTPPLVGILWTNFYEYLLHFLPDQAGKPRGSNLYAYQEKLKGRTFTGRYVGSNYGGWGFNYLYFKRQPGGYGKGPVMTAAVLSPTDAAAASSQLTDEDLRAVPFFRPGGNRTKVVSWVKQSDGSSQETTDRLGALYGPNGSDFAARHRDTLLARMIPALSLATGRDAVEAFGTPQENFNFDMNAPAFRADTEVPPWPQVRLPGRNWWHSDLRQVAYPYVRRLYDRLVGLGSLNEKSQ